jgi:hypothetical protein
MLSAWQLFRILHFSILSSNIWFSHSLTSVNANTTFKCYLIIFKIHKISFKISFKRSHSLLHISASRSHHLSKINWRKSPHCTDSRSKYFNVAIACHRNLEIYARLSFIFQYVLLKFIFALQCSIFLLQFMKLQILLFWPLFIILHFFVQLH